MTTRYFIATASAFILLGAGCAISQPPPEPVQSESAQEENGAAPETEGTETVTTTSGQKERSASTELGTVQIDIQKDTEVKIEPTNSKEPIVPPAKTVREFRITAKQWAFEPGRITVKQGDTVRLNVASIDVGHGLLISAYNVNKVLNPGATVTVEFTADKKGTFPIICSVQCGAGHPSMRGELVVE